MFLENIIQPFAKSWNHCIFQEYSVQFSSENFIYPIRAIQFTAPSSIKLEKNERKTKTKNKT